MLASADALTPEAASLAVTGVALARPLSALLEWRRDERGPEAVMLGIELAQGQLLGQRKAPLIAGGHPNRLSVLLAGLDVHT